MKTTLESPQHFGIYPKVMTDLYSCIICGIIKSIPCSIKTEYIPSSHGDLYLSNDFVTQAKLSLVIIPQAEFHDVVSKSEG